MILSRSTSPVSNAITISQWRNVDFLSVNRVYRGRTESKLSYRFGQLQNQPGWDLGLCSGVVRLVTFRYVSSATRGCCTFATVAVFKLFSSRDIDKYPYYWIIDHRVDPWLIVNAVALRGVLHPVHHRQNHCRNLPLMRHAPKTGNFSSHPTCNNNSSRRSQAKKGTPSLELPSDHPENTITALSDLY